MVSTIDYKRIIENRPVFFDKQCTRCAYEKNAHTNLICVECNYGIEKVSPLHLVNIFSFALVSIIGIGSNVTWNGFGLPWVLFLWAVFWVGVYHYIILKKDSMVLFVICGMTATSLAFAILSYEGFKQSPKASLVIGILVGLAFLTLIVGFIKSCVDFKNTNQLPWYKLLAIISTLGALDFLLLSFVFNLPLEILVRLHDSMLSFISQITSPSMTGFVDTISGFLELNLAARMCLLVLYLAFTFSFNVVVETFKEQSEIEAAREIKNIIRNTIINSKKAFKPLVQIFWYINENVLSYTVIPWVTYFLILTVLLKLFELSRVLATANTVSIWRSLITIALTFSLCILIPIFVIAVGRFNKEHHVPLASNILIANIKLVAAVVQAIFVMSILVWVFALFTQHSNLKLISLVIKQYFAPFSQVYFNHSFLISLVIFPIAYTYAMVKTKTWRWN